MSSRSNCQYAFRVTFTLRIHAHMHEEAYCTVLEAASSKPPEKDVLILRICHS